MSVNMLKLKAAISAVYMEQPEILKPRLNLTKRALRAASEPAEGVAEKAVVEPVETTAFGARGRLPPS